MIEKSIYLSDPCNLPAVMDITDLSDDEIEEIVGRFKQSHWRFPGQLKGELCINIDGTSFIRHHFKKREILWQSI